MNILYLLLAAVAQASIFDFFQNQFQGQRRDPGFEAERLNANCEQYLCGDTLQCVKGPSQCPCPFPLSQLRCFLPNGNYLCISKPAGEIASKYADPKTNWKIDEGGDVRDCGWVSRNYKA